MIFLVRRSVLGGETFEMVEVTFASRKAESAYIKLRKRGPKILAEIDQALEQLETNPKDMELMRKRTIRKMKGKYKDKCIPLLERFWLSFDFSVASRRHREHGAFQKLPRFQKWGECWHFRQSLKFWQFRQCFYGFLCELRVSVVRITLNLLRKGISNGVNLREFQCKGPCLTTRLESVGTCQEV